MIHVLFDFERAPFNDFAFQVTVLILFVLTHLVVGGKFTMMTARSHDSSEQRSAATIVAATDNIHDRDGACKEVEIVLFVNHVVSLLDSFFQEHGLSLGEWLGLIETEQSEVASILLRRIRWHWNRRWLWQDFRRGLGLQRLVLMDFMNPFEIEEIRKRQRNVM